MPAIRCITFDWGDTLAANVGMPYIATQRRAFARLAEDLKGLGCDVPADWVAVGMRELEQAWESTIDEARNPEHREFDFRAMLDRWLGRADAMAADAHGVRLAVERAMAALTDTIAAYAESAPTLSLLKARGYRIGILSHVPWPGDACRAWFARRGLAAYLDFYSLSCEVGWIKPSPRHLRHALDQAGCRPEEVLHVGDHPVRDVHGAKAHGMRTCLRLTEGVYAQELIESCQPDAEIMRLSEIVDVVARLEAGK
jgi:putative hydrolase of the HAD superfamily